jgi:hypothetical protein
MDAFCPVAKGSMVIQHPHLFRTNPACAYAIFDHLLAISRIATERKM